LASFLKIFWEKALEIDFLYIFVAKDLQMMANMRVYNWSWRSFPVETVI